MAEPVSIEQLEQCSRGRPDRVLRLSGRLEGEPYELLIYRGFSSSTTHPTAFDPDHPVLPAGTEIDSAELLSGPLNPASEQRLAGPAPLAHFLDPAHWL
jgi:hypothetical protein